MDRTRAEAARRLQRALDRTGLGAAAGRARDVAATVRQLLRRPRLLGRSRGDKDR